MRVGTAVRFWTRVVEVLGPNLGRDTDCPEGFRGIPQSIQGQYQATSASFQIPSNYSFILGFEVFTAMVTKSIIFWDVRPCILLSCNQRFGGKCRLHLQG
jgi:hypothetical protein